MNPFTKIQSTVDPIPSTGLYLRIRKVIFIYYIQEAYGDFGLCDCVQNTAGEVFEAVGAFPPRTRRLSLPLLHHNLCPLVSRENTRREEKQNTFRSLLKFRRRPSFPPCYFPKGS